MDLIFLTVIAVLVGLGFALQHWICRWKKALLLRLLPGGLLLLTAVGCWIPVIGIPFWDDLIAFICVFFLGFGTGFLWLGGLFAWIAYAAGRIAQNKRK